MIKKLRLRFIISALLSIFIVLAATIAAINISNYLKSDKETNHLLDQVVESERQSMRRQYSGYMGEGGMGGQGGGSFDNEGHYFKESDPGKDDPRGQYFVTVYGTEGNVWYTNYHIISADKEANQKMSEQVYNGTETSGKMGSFRFKKVYAKDVVKYQTYMMGMGSPTPTEAEATIEATYVAFVDTRETMHAVSNFVVSSIIVAAVSYTVLAALIIISSHFIFKTSEESYRKQKAFITNASHELKTPLTIINTDVEILKMDNGENEWTDSICDQVRRLTMMTNQLVTLSKLDEGNLNNYPFTLFSLSKLAKESADAFAPTYEKNGFIFNNGIDENIDYKGNQYLINELFYIFLDNALKYTSAKGEIDFKVKKNNKNRIEILFSNHTDDNEVDVDQLFERFYRSPHSNNNKKEGSGIGLSIAKEIIDLHKGKVSVSLKEGKIYFNIIL